MNREGAGLAVDLGGTRVRVATVVEGVTLLGRVEEPSWFDEGPRGTVRQIERLANRSLQAAGVQSGALRGVTVATPGPLDTKRGVVFDPPNLPGWNNVPLQAWLEAQLGVPARILNDANAAAVGEHRMGVGRGTRDMVYLTLSTGIGGGVIVDGQLLEGASGTAGEIGHMTVDFNGPVCPCGNVGCLEVLASGLNLARRFQSAVGAGEPTKLRTQAEAGRVSAADIARAAREGDALAGRMFEDAARAIGAGVVSCIHVFNPEVVVLGGGMTNAGELLFAPVRRAVAAHAMRVPREAVRIERAELGDDVGLVGAAMMPTDRTESF